MTLSARRRSKGSIAWPSWPWTCAGRGTTATDEVWRQLDPELWDLTHNPWVVLQTVSRGPARAQRWPIPAFRKNVDGSAWKPARQAAEPPPGFSRHHAQSPLTLRRLFQHGVHAERGAADLLGRAGQRGRRSAQGRQRPGRAGGRRGAALPAGLFPPGDRQGRRAAGALSLTTIPGSCRSRRCASRTASGCGWRSRCPATRSGCAPGRCRSAG